jgi:hypothetical protein
MKKSDIIEINKALNNCKNLSGVKFAYFLAKNLNIIKDEIESIKSAIEFSKEYKEFDNERMVLATKHAKKENGQPVIKDNSFVLEDEAGFKKDFGKLSEEYTETIEAREKQTEEFNTLLKEESEIKLFKISLKDIPEGITGKQMIGISELIMEDEKEIKA